MKKWVIFIIGFISGIIATFLVALLFSDSGNATNDGVTLFDKPGECISTKAFEVMQVVGECQALAYEVEWNEVLEMYTQTGLLVLVTNDNGIYYYDDQIIEVPSGQCMRQIGVFRYQTKSEIEKTVPIVKLMKR